ncbi:MAG: CsbD family protein [Bdellovibrionales bacterium]
MNQDQMQGKFEQLKGKIKETWGRLSDDDIALANGKMEQFLGKVQETYGVTKEAAQKSYDEIAKACVFTAEKSCGSAADKAA